jgi:hypothetical protein
MAQIQSQYDEVRIPFTKMSYTPDVPSTNLGPNEYNYGLNVETDARGVRSMAGDLEILNTIPGTPTFVSGGFRLQNEFWFIVATTEGKWYASNGVSVSWYDITPGGTTFTGYSQNTNITDGWNGNIAFFNDTQNPPMFFPNEVGATLVMYSNTLPAGISNIAYVNPTTQRITFTQPYTTTPFLSGDKIVISGVNAYYNGNFVVVSSTTTTVDYLATPSSAYPGASNSQQVAPLYTWNYNPDWKKLKAGWMRIYSTPNVGSLLVAGDLTATLLNDTDVEFPITIQWSQKFGVNQVPDTWIPTITNVANQFDAPLRGRSYDAFPCNGQLFVSSYWDTVVLSPINYAATSTSVLGVRLANQGRGLLSANCWANTDKNVYGVDARDIWVFDGTNFTGIGNQRVKNWFFDQLDPLHYDRVFMQCNTQRNQIEIYYPTPDATNGVPNRMLSYRYDLDCWNSPREITMGATYAVESPIYIENIPNFGSRTVVYAQGSTNSKLIQKDQGFAWADGSPIESVFRRDNIKLLKDYSGKLMVHRILPELNNMGADAFADDDELPIDPSTSTNKGNVTVIISGATSVGSAPTSKTPVTKPVDTTSPWYQIDQNAFRVNTIELTNTSNNSIWMCSATTWQFTQVEDDR